MIPIDCKITNFSLYLFVSFFWEVTIIISYLAPNKLLVENLLASTLRIQSFSAHYAVLWTENSMKSISTNQISHYGKYGMHDCQSPCPSYWYKSGCAILRWCIFTFCFASSSSNVWLAFQAKNNARSIPACTALTHQSHNTCTYTNRHLRG